MPTPYNVHFVLVSHWSLQSTDMLLLHAPRFLGAGLGNMLWCITLQLIALFSNFVSIFLTSISVGTSYSSYSTCLLRLATNSC